MVAMPSSSLYAGMTTDTWAGSATRLVPQLDLADPVEQVLEQLAVAGHEVRHHAPLQRLETEDEQQHRQHARLHVAARVAQPPRVVRVPDAEAEAGGQEHGAQDDEHLEGLVHGVDAQDGGRGPLDV